MVLQLAEVLGLELRERNALLVSAGFVGAYPSTPLDATAMAPVNRAVEFLLAKQEPYPVVLLDRCWNVVRTNNGARRLLGAFLDPGLVDSSLPQNLMRATFHPQGLRPHVVNWAEVAALALERIERAHHAHPADEARRSLLDEVRAYPDVATVARSTPAGGMPVATLHLRRGDVELRLFVLFTSVGTPLDVTAQELTVETLFPADEATERWCREPS